MDEEALDGDAGRPEIVVAFGAVDVEHAMRNFGIVAKKLKLWTATVVSGERFLGVSSDGRESRPNSNVPQTLYPTSTSSTASGFSLFTLMNLKGA